MSNPNIATGVRCAAALSTQTKTAVAIDEVCRAAAAELGGPPDLAAVFASAHHATDFDRIAGTVAERVGTGRVGPDPPVLCNRRRVAG